MQELNVCTVWHVAEFDTILSSISVFVLWTEVAFDKLSSKKDDASICSDLTH